MPTVRIPLHSHKYPGLYAIVDEEDAELVDQYRWNVLRAGETCYAQTRVCDKTLYMHRLITLVKEGLVVDHINHDGLDNRRLNLRVCSHQVNIVNRRGPQKNSGQYVGVYQERGGRWSAGIFVHGKRKRLGMFDSPHDAAKVRDREMFRLYGQCAYLNFPEDYE